MRRFLLLFACLACSKVERSAEQTPPPPPPVVAPKPAQPPEVIKDYCGKIQSSFKRYRWGDSGCLEQEWHFVRRSVWGNPLVWRIYGVEKNVAKKDSTLILCGVHGDEITPIKFCYDVIKHLDAIVEGRVVDPLTKAPFRLEDRIVVVAPLANPDSFLRKRPTRTNANGIDVNRNFPTKDFARYALKEWRERYGALKRRYPGKKAMSEPETLFQVNLIKRYRPDKIISVHAPLTILDYDGPSSRVIGGEVGVRANQLLINMSRRARGYRIKDYPFFTGSLGNYAGNERNIPTYTLELPTANPANHRRYWKRFRSLIESAIWHNMGDSPEVAYKSED